MTNLGRGSVQEADLKVQWMRFEEQEKNEDFKILRYKIYRLLSMTNYNYH